MKLNSTLEIKGKEDSLSNLYLDIKNKVNIFCTKYKLTYSFKLKKNKLLLDVKRNK